MPCNSGELDYDCCEQPIPVTPTKPHTMQGPVTTIRMPKIQYVSLISMSHSVRKRGGKLIIRIQNYNLLATLQVIVLNFIHLTYDNGFFIFYRNAEKSSEICVRFPISFNSRLRLGINISEEGYPLQFLYIFCI